MTARSLAEVQRAFHAIAVGRAPLASAAGLVRGGAIAAATRMQVYAHAYRARLHAVLGDDFSRLAAALGGDRFAALIDRYVDGCPPCAPSIGDAGARLADFLAGEFDAPPWAADLARLERARSDAFTAADATPLDREALAAIAPDDVPELALALVPSAAIVSLGWNADELWDEPAGAAQPAARTVLVWRRDLEVVHRTLDRDEAGAIAVVAGGGSFSAVCEALADHPSPIERAIELMLRWVDAAILHAEVP